MSEGEYLLIDTHFHLLKNDLPILIKKSDYVAFLGAQLRQNIFRYIETAISRGKLAITQKIRDFRHDVLCHLKLYKPYGHFGQSMHNKTQTINIPYENLLMDKTSIPEKKGASPHDYNSSFSQKKNQRCPSFQKVEHEHFLKPGWLARGGSTLLQTGRQTI